MSKWIRETDASVIGQGANARKIKLKVLALLYDLVLNDDTIFSEQPFLVRDTVLNDANLLNHFFNSLVKGNLAMPQEG